MLYDSEYLFSPHLIFYHPIVGDNMLQADLERLLQQERRQSEQLRSEINELSAQMKRLDTDALQKEILSLGTSIGLYLVCFVFVVVVVSHFG